MKQLWLGLCLLSACASALAAETTVRIQYRPGDADFKNITTPAGWCAQSTWICGIVPTVDIPITFDKVTEQGAEDIRNRFFVQLPGKRTVEVTNASGARFKVDFEFEYFGQTVLNSPFDLHRNPVYSPSAGPCQVTELAGTMRVTYVWKLASSTSPGACYSDGIGAPAGLVQDNQVTRSGAGFKVKAPPPYNMEPGVYMGHLDYSVGPGGDFDFGNDVTNHPNSVRVNFEYHVLQDFSVKFPANSDRIILEPPGGWIHWQQRGAKPPRLYRDVPLRLTSTGPFKFWLYCEFTLGANCGIRNLRTAQTVPVETALTLPGTVLLDGRAVERLPVSPTMANTLNMRMAAPVREAPGQIHYQVSGAALDEMLPNSGDTYEGWIVLIFDARI